MYHRSACRHTLGKCSLCVIIVVTRLAQWTLGLNIKGLDKYNMPRSGDVMVSVP